MVMSGSTPARTPTRHKTEASARTPLFWFGKRGFDIAFSLACLPLVAAVCLVLLLVNPIGNPGPVFFTQQRMGRKGVTFSIIKFRTMRVSDRIERGAHDPVEDERITALGRLLRRLRIDELPQVLNILRGEMSLVGPRPDYVEHANVYLRTVPGYRQRYWVRPGITGFAQVEMGYADGYDSVVRKTYLDVVYINNAGWRLDLRIIMRTILVVLSGFGSR